MLKTHISNQILSCGKLNMYKSAKGEIHLCQGRFSAYKVSGKIHKGCVEGMSVSVCEKLCVFTKKHKAWNRLILRASNDLSVVLNTKDHDEKIVVIYFVWKDSI